MQIRPKGHLFSVTFFFFPLSVFECTFSYYGLTENSRSRSSTCPQTITSLSSSFSHNNHVLQLLYQLSSDSLLIIILKPSAIGFRPK